MTGARTTALAETRHSRFIEQTGGIRPECRRSRSATLVAKPVVHYRGGKSQLLASGADFTGIKIAAGGLGMNFSNSPGRTNAVSGMGRGKP